MGQNPGPFTLSGTCTYLLGLGRNKILIDTGQGLTEYTNLLFAFLDTHQMNITTILLTHYHDDHRHGVEPIREVFKSRNLRAPSVYKFPHPLDSSVQWASETISDGQLFETEGCTLTSYTTPGHTEDSTVFYLHEEDALFSGDTILGSGTSVFENLSQLMKSLQRILTLGGAVFTIYPGHGPVIENGKSVVHQLIKHRNKRELEIVGLLRTMGPQTAISLVASIYKDYPRAVWPAAEHGIEQHMCKLQNEGKVCASKEGWTFVKGPQI